MFASTPTVFAYQSSLALLIDRYGLLFCMAVTEHCVNELMSFFSSVLLGRPSHATHDFEGVASFVETGVLLPLPCDVHSFVSNVVFLFVFQGSQLGYGQAYMAYHRSLEVEWNDEVCVWWFPYTSSSWKVLDVPAGAVPSWKRNVDDFQVECLATSVSEKFKPELRKTLGRARIAVNTAYGSLSGFPGPSEDGLVVEGDSLEKDAESNPRDLKSENDRELSASQRILALFGDHDLSAQTNV